MSTWRPSNELRWFRRTEINGKTSYERTVLQQKWCEFAPTESDPLHCNVEWRDVPVEVQE